MSSGVLCAAGRGSAQAWATICAGIGCVRNSCVMDRRFEPIKMGLVPEDALEPLTPELGTLPLPVRARRMLQLAAPVFRTVAPIAGTQPVKLYLGLPSLSSSTSPWLKGFALHLGKLAGVSIDASGSRVVPAGRAAVLKALELALDALEKNPTSRIIVGGVDTYFDLRLLSELDAAQRLLGPRVMDGFVPGEGAAFVVLAHESAHGTAEDGSVQVVAAASVQDPAHRYSEVPARGEGLAQCLDVLRSRLADRSSAPVESVFAGLNGEHFESKL